MSASPWSGVFPAITTQFHEDQALNLPGTVAHVEHLVASGIQGLVLCGSLGENQTLTNDEKRSVVSAAVKAVGGKIPVLTGVAESSTRAAVQYVQDCARLGVSGFMIMPPMVYRPDADEAKAYFRTVSTATDLPWMLYNNPLAYTVDVTPEQLVEYAEQPNLMAVKESSGNPRRITEIRLLLKNRLQLFAGVDDLILESSIVGIDGWVAGSGIGFPEENQKLWQLLQAGEWEKARQLYHWCAPLMKLDTYPKFVQYIKLIVQEAGLGKEWVRAPREVLRGDERARVLRIIQAALANRPH